MYQQFVNLKSAFQREIDSTGIILYEKMTESWKQSSDCESLNDTNEKKSR